MVALQAWPMPWVPEGLQTRAPVPLMVHMREAGQPHWGAVSLHGLSEHGVPVLEDVTPPGPLVCIEELIVLEVVFEPVDV